MPVLLFAISLFISCSESNKPEYVFPDPETTPTVTLSLVDKGHDFVVFTAKTTYADQCAYMCIESGSATPSVEELFANGTPISTTQSVELRVDGLAAETAYQIVTAVADEEKSVHGMSLSFVTASDQPASPYPDGMVVESFEKNFEDGGVAKGFIAVADLKANPSLKFYPTHLNPAKTPSSAFEHFKTLNYGTPFILSNGGYFWEGASLSLCVTDGDVKSIATQTAYPKVNGEQITAYPVRAALGLHADGSFEATWVYCISGKPYSFPSPLDNDERTETYMSNPPTSKTEGAVLWPPQQAIGGGPMLVFEGENVAMEYYYREIMDTGGTAGTSRQPRTAVGGTKDGKVMLLVCDGRGKNGSNGLTLSEMADIFVEKGMDYAINLDGGGSSTIVGHDGAVMNNPSDGSERGVPTVVVLSSK